MNVNGEMLIGSESKKGSGSSFYAVDPTMDQMLEPAFTSSTADDIDHAAHLAWQAFDYYRSTQPEIRAIFLERCADEILALGDSLIERAVAETGLPKVRIEGERGRTITQLQLFASVIRGGNYLDLRIDPALPDRHPFPRPDLRQRMIALGPVAVFGASNFPLAFSVAGGDTASALAAGCPVIVKAHSAHPGTSELVGKAIQKAVKECNLPEGVFSLLYDCGYEVGSALVSHPLIKAVGFTGSQTGGVALMKLASARQEPIPVYAEMSSVNPVFLMPEALKVRGTEIAKDFINSLTLGAGQFCTNPGLVLACSGSEFNSFMSAATLAIKDEACQTMLTANIQQSYNAANASLNDHPAITLFATSQPCNTPTHSPAALYKTKAADFINNPELHNEIFGASALIIECDHPDDFTKVAEQLEGQLTATVHLESEDYSCAKILLPTLERKAGRILCNGFGTGVEVGYTMVHGGPFPASSDSRTTSVGASAINRFVRPVCYQNLPTELLPTELKDENTFSFPRMINGQKEH